MTQTGQGEHGVTLPAHRNPEAIRQGRTAAIFAEEAARTNKAQRYEWIREHMGGLAEVLRGMQTHSPIEFDAAIAASMTKLSR